MESRVVKILALCLLVLVVPATAMAQTSRVEGMAIQGDYIKDYTGIYQYTSQVANVGNLVYGELGVSAGGTPVDRSVGAVMGDWFEGRMGTWAVHMRQFTPQLGQGDALGGQPAPGDFGADPNFHTNEQFDLMWGRKFGTASLGLRLNRSFAHHEFDNLPTIYSNLEFDFPQGVGSENLARNILGVGVGFGWEMSPTTNIETNLFWQSRTFEIVDSTGATLAEDDGSTTYQLAARAWWQWQPNLMVVPVFKWYSYDLSTTGTIVPVAENSLRGWQAGVAGNWTVGANDLFTIGVTFAQNKVEQDADILGSGFDNGTVTESFTPQVFAALESHVNSWLTLRFGANKGAWYNLEYEDDDTPSTETFHESPFFMALGAGVKVGGVQLDAIVNDAFPHNGLNFISGNTTTPVFPKVSATYAF